MFEHIINYIIAKYKVQNFNNFFVFGSDNENVSIIKKFHRYVFDNNFIANADVVNYLSIFCIIQRTIKSFKKLIFIWRLKNATKSSVDIDLLMNSLNSYPEEQKVSVYHNKTIYTFRLTDIINIWKESLAKSITMSPMPELPKNPYTNLKFDRGHLLKFYIHIRYHSKFMVPKIIQQFIDCEMNIELFRIHAYPDLIHTSIDNYIKNGYTESLYYDCMNMVSSYRRSLNYRRLFEDISLNKKTRVVEIMKPTLKKYLYYKKSCNPKIKNLNKIGIVSNLKCIFEMYPLLGRKIVRVNRRSINFSTENVVISNSTNTSDVEEQAENNDDENENEEETDTDDCILTDSDDEDEEEYHRRWEEEMHLVSNLMND